MGHVVPVSDRVSRSVGRYYAVVRSDTVQLVADRIVCVMRSAAMATRESEECHCSHASRTENEAKNVEIHSGGHGE